jgi:hypothetical protein
MKINRIEGETRVLGESQGYLGLSIRDEAQEWGPQMVSEWQPSATEVELIAAGAPINLTVLGAAHPPVILSVGDVTPENERFQVVDGSDSGHCCFEVSVIDTSRPKNGRLSQCVCECLEEEDAKLIARLLNQENPR